MSNADDKEVLPEGYKYYQIFWCYGCQSCWRMDDKDNLTRTPHQLGQKEIELPADVRAALEKT